MGDSLQDLGLKVTLVPQVRLTPDKVCKVITACVIIHNTCKVRQFPEPLEDSPGDGDEEDDTEVIHPDVVMDLSQRLFVLPEDVHVKVFCTAERLLLQQQQQQRQQAA
ncbi:hypothetical protein Q8A73_007136 [Channa argus]|nr:hypothetical protein Q8A73_007136 [Channa argus]